MTSAVERIPSVLSADDTSALEQIAAELAQPDLNPDRRAELEQAITDIAEKYTCDPRLADD